MTSETKVQQRLTEVRRTVPDAGALQLLIRHGFVPNSSATSHLTLSSTGAGHAKVQFNSPRASRIDSAGAMINVWQAPKVGASLLPFCPLRMWAVFTDVPSRYYRCPV